MAATFRSPSSSSAHQSTSSYSRDHTSRAAPVKIFDNIKRTLTPSKTSRPQGSEDGLQHARSRSRFLQEDDLARPTVEQIAMGLHLSRTPHLPPHASPASSPTYYRLARVESNPTPTDGGSLLSRRHSSAHHRPHGSLSIPSRTAPPLPPPPARSALKAPRASTPSSASPKASLQTFDSSSTPPSSIGPRTPSSHSPARHFTNRLSRFARGIVTGGSGHRLGSNSQSTSEVSVALSEPLRKSVRFEPTEDIEE